MTEDNEQNRLVDFICETYNSDELADLYFRHFPDFHEIISEGKPLRFNVWSFVRYCARRGFLPALHVILAEQRPVPYTRRFANEQTADHQVTTVSLDQPQTLQQYEPLSLAVASDQAWATHDTLGGQDLWPEYYDNTAPGNGDFSTASSDLSELLKGYRNYLKGVVAQYLPNDYQSWTYLLIGLIVAFVFVVAIGIGLLRRDPEEQVDVTTPRFVLQPGDSVSVPIAYRQTAFVATTHVPPQTLSITVQDCGGSYCYLLLVSNLTQTSVYAKELNCILADPFVVAIADGDRDNYRVIVSQLAEGFDGRACLNWPTPAP